MSCTQRFFIMDLARPWKNWTMQHYESIILCVNEEKAFIACVNTKP